MKIFIDLDGTLLNVKRKCYYVYYDMLTLNKFETLDIETYWCLKRNGNSETFISSKTCPPDFIEYYIERRRKLIESYYYLGFDTLIHDVHISLKKLACENDLYLVTLRENNDNLYKQLYFLDLKKYFDHIYNGKTKEENIKKGDFDRDSIIIGDTEIDVNAGKNLGITTVAVYSGLRNREYLKKLFPSFVFSDLKSFTFS